MPGSWARERLQNEGQDSVVAVEQEVSAPPTSNANTHAVRLCTFRLCDSTFCEHTLAGWRPHAHCVSTAVQTVHS